jgi:hypothetical protein
MSPDFKIECFKNWNFQKLDFSKLDSFEYGFCKMNSFHMYFSEWIFHFLFLICWPQKRANIVPRPEFCPAKKKGL